MPKKIIVCDDEADTRRLVKFLLSKEGYEVDDAKDGASCLAKAKKKKYDLVLLDIMMPGMGFREVVEKLEKTSNSKNTKVCYFSVVQWPEAERKQLMAYKNVVSYIQKPCTNEELVASVNGLFLT